MTLIVGLGGTTKPGSTTELVLHEALHAARRAGAEVRVFGGEFLAGLPHYGTPEASRSAAAAELVDAIRAADGLVVASPGYHGTISGLLKNAIDYFEETAKDHRVYLDGVPVGLIATAYGWQATGGTLVALRSIVHSLRGWPTPMGAAIRSTGGLFVGQTCTDPDVRAQLDLVGRQVVEFAGLNTRRVPSEA